MVDSSTFEKKLFEELELHQGERISAFEHDGQKYWLKQTEKTCGVMRLLKGDAHRALRREICELCKLERRHARVPKMAFKQKSNKHQQFFVIEDSGLTLKDWLSKSDISQLRLTKILNDSADALAELHEMKLTHGRPALRDICWKSGQITFIDFESKTQHLNLEKRQIRDLLLYIHSLYRYLGPQNELIEEVIRHYRNAGGEWIWQQSKRYLNKWQWLYYIAFSLRFHGGRDVKPIYWVLKHFRNISEKNRVEGIST